MNFIDVSKITDMSDLFSDEDLSQFAGDISQWDVSRVADMSRMFENSQFNGDISKWNVSKVTNMWGMFSGSQFTGDLNKWKVSDGTDMEDAFMDSALEKMGKIPKWYKPKEDFFGGEYVPDYTKNMLI
ncbi:BspA family leucine-rich repeat surface protein [uncultured Fibrobacter sp.]|uniref:BspA family leucine-rich repeat surface protein n=2 Tax=uncultured Fibrobacter sp. TaxID=261512 RepID=UPI0025F3E690|nr:BspA family leucine-rich repeat surface protein [uncultured Fibrobacter sp.]